MVIQDEFGGIILNLGPFEGAGTTNIPGSLSLNSSFLYMIYSDINPVEIRSFTDELSITIYYYYKIILILSIQIP